MEPTLPPPPSSGPIGPIPPFGSPPPSPASLGGGPVPPTGPPGYRWQPGGPWVANVPPRTHGLATASLVCGLVGLLLFMLLAVLPILALIFGLISRSAIARSNGALIGAGRAKAGVALGIVGIVFFGLFAWAVATDRIGGDTDDTSVFALDEGACVETLPDEDDLVMSLPVVDCAEPHEAEVYLVVELNPDRSRNYPGDTEVELETQNECGEAFESFVGLEYQDSVLEVFYLVPQDLSWRSSRGEVTCLIFDPGNPTTVGTLENARR